MTPDDTGALVVGLMLFSAAAGNLVVWRALYREVLRRGEG